MILLRRCSSPRCFFKAFCILAPRIFHQHYNDESCIYYLVYWPNTSPRACEMKYEESTSFYSRCPRNLRILRLMCSAMMRHYPSRPCTAIQYFTGSSWASLDRRKAHWHIGSPLCSTIESTCRTERYLEPPQLPCCWDIAALHYFASLQIPLWPSSQNQAYSKRTTRILSWDRLLYHQYERMSICLSILSTFASEVPKEVAA